MSYHNGDLSLGETVLGTNVLIALLVSARRYYIQLLTIATRIKPVANHCSVTDVKMKRDVVRFQFIALPVKDMELIDMYNPIEM